MAQRQGQGKHQKVNQSFFSFVKQKKTEKKTIKKIIIIICLVSWKTEKNFSSFNLIQYTLKHTFCSLFSKTL